MSVIYEICGEYYIEAIPGRFTEASNMHKPYYWQTKEEVEQSYLMGPGQICQYCKVEKHVLVDSYADVDIEVEYGEYW